MSRPRGLEPEAPSADQAQRRFVLLRGLRWLATGLVTPVLVLVMLERGFSLGDIGVITAAQGAVVLLLELPTGGLTDALGRRPALLMASAFGLCSVALFVVAESMPLMVLVFALQGVYRALDSGPLEAWYVDCAQRADPAADIGTGLARGGLALGVGMGLGCLISGAFVTLAQADAWGLGRLDPLTSPLLASVALQLVTLFAVTTLMVEAPRVHDSPSRRSALVEAAHSTPRVVVQAIELIRGNHVLLGLIAVELLWGFGMTAFETFTPARLADEVGTTDAAVLLGPTQAAAWALFAAAATGAPALMRWLGGAYAAATLRVVQGLAVVGIALATGPFGVVAAFLLTLGVHGAANPVHAALLHRTIDGPTHRATVVSANSLTAQTGGMLGGIALGALADTTSITVAVLAGALALAAAAPLYLPARRIPASDHAGSR